MVLKIDGTDVLPYVAYRGIKWQHSDLDSPDSGRTLDGRMHRGRVASKIRLDITCRPLKRDEARVLLNLLNSEYITVEYEDPEQGFVIKSMYSNNYPASYMVEDDQGNEWWDGITFPLIEV